MDPRLNELKCWSAQMLAQSGIALSQNWQCAVVAGDASFRRYFRIQDGEHSWIAVDAPPEKEDSAPFVAVARSWQQLEVNVPDILAADLQLGFMLLQDFGDEQYLTHLNQDSADRLYQPAFSELLKLQACTEVDGQALPPYDIAMLTREVELFREWFLQKLLEYPLSEHHNRLLDELFAGLIGSALEQPQVCVHRDYHSRNLMLCDNGQVGVIDFQDAVHGPVTYDLVSLLRDCYIAWPQTRIDAWRDSFLLELQKSPTYAAVDNTQFARWFDLMGMQRHLKAIGIFARLKIRDGKNGYLPDIPRTMGYLINVADQYPEFADASAWLRQDIVPRMQQSGFFEADAMKRWLS